MIARWRKPEGNCDARFDTGDFGRCSGLDDCAGPAPRPMIQNSRSALRSAMVRAATPTAPIIRCSSAPRLLPDAPRNAWSIHFLPLADRRLARRPFHRAASTSVAFMTLPSVTPSEIRTALLLRDEIALLDLRHEAAFATGHPLFAANMAAGRIALEAEMRLPRKDVPVVLYDDGEGLVAQAADRLRGIGLQQRSSARRRARRAGGRRATNFSRTSTPTPKRLANWWSRAATRRPCPPMKSPP